MRKTWKKVIALSLMAAMAVSAAGCSKSGQTSTEGGSAQTQAGSKETEAGGSTGGSGEYKDTVVWAQGADVTSLDPHQGKETPAVEVTDQIFDTLTVVDAATGELQPLIAESWDQNSDTSYTFHIRQGVKFHDGSEVKAEDVKFSLDRAINSAAVSYIVDFIDRVDVVDDYTVNVELKAPYAPALRNLSVPFAAIVPKAVVEADEEAFKLHPIGTGPVSYTHLDVYKRQLENLALERCGGRLLSDSIFLMEDAVQAMKEAVAEDDMGKIIKYDEIFHKQILLSGQMERLTSLWETLSPLNGAMFYTIKQINEYVSEMQADLDQEDIAAQAGRRGNNYLEHKWLLEILQRGNLEQSRSAINTHYIANGERIYRIGMKMKNQELFYHV